MRAVVQLGGRCLPMPLRYPALDGGDADSSPGGGIAGGQAIGQGGGDDGIAGGAIMGGDVDLATAPAAAGFGQGAAAQGFVQAQLDQAIEGVGEGVAA